MDGNAESDWWEMSVHWLYETRAVLVLRSEVQGNACALDLRQQPLQASNNGGCSCGYGNETPTCWETGRSFIRRHFVLSKRCDYGVFSGHQVSSTRELAVSPGLGKTEM